MQRNPRSLFHRRPLRGRERLHRKRVDLVAHDFLESVVDQALPLDRALVFETGRDDDSPKMAAALPGANVPDVQVALVDHLDVDRRQTLAQRSFDPRTAIGSIGHGGA